MCMMICIIWRNEGGQRCHFEFSSDRWNSIWGFETEPLFCVSAFSDCVWKGPKDPFWCSHRQSSEAITDSRNMNS